MFFELRIYPLKEGKAEAFVKWMDDDIIPFQRSRGMTVLGSFYEENDDHYVWIRRFESEEEREQLYEAVYQSDEWKNDYAPTIGDYIDRSGIQVIRLKSTPRSYIR